MHSGAVYLSDIVEQFLDALARWLRLEPQLNEPGSIFGMALLFDLDNAKGPRPLQKPGPLPAPPLGSGWFVYLGSTSGPESGTSPEVRLRSYVQIRLWPKNITVPIRQPLLLRSTFLQYAGSSNLTRWMYCGSVSLAYAASDSGVTGTNPMSPELT